MRVDYLKSYKYCYLYLVFDSLKRRKWRKGRSKEENVMKKHRSLLVAVTAVYMLSVTNMQACLTTFINDKMSKIMVYNKQDKTFTCIRKNEKRRFGNQHQRAHFVLYVQQKNKPVFSRLYTCKQVRCSKTGNIQLKFSDIQNGSSVTQLFDITKNEPYSSMVQDLPMVQKSCQSCGGN